VTTRFVLATANPDKAAEIARILEDAGAPVELVARPADVPDVDENGATLEENARLKALALVEATGLPAIADDTGLEVDALGGAPGAHTARYAGPDGDYAANRRALLEALRGTADRRARFRTVVALVVPGGSEVLAEGVLEGRITTTERGSKGFGYDSIFEVAGRTLAEMGEEEKNRISHRARALQALAVRVTPGG